MSLPLVSIITPCFNSAAYLEETIQSIRAQEYHHIEHIVIDGGSTDATLDILRQYEDKLAWISEPDKGQSDAINKGFRLARGEIVAWLNGDDVYFPWSVRLGVEELLAHPDAGMVYGSAVLIDDKGQTVAQRPVEDFSLDRLLNEGDYIFQPTVFMRYSALKDVNLLNTNLHYCMDYDLWLKIGKKHPVSCVHSSPLAKYRLHSASKTTYIPYKMIQERHDIAREHDGDAINVALKALYTKWAIHVSEDFAQGPSCFRLNWLGADYYKLPDSVRREGKTILADVFVQAGFYSRKTGDLVLASEWFKQAVRLDWKWLLNSGVFLTMLRAWGRKACLG